ncbi:UrcA family protein [Croceicoccus sp. BE223]|uniref:UrcA family protein n=1 Tax=Croceicoccus sp. BE223 TaxID=2817716 RepID=UPI002859E1F9|nr:UrcA family protein [Croceicoccus sp. BE223]MDR7102111.1 UrcA family protein [Croceicoccus sp. BE223]
MKFLLAALASAGLVLSSGPAFAKAPEERPRAAQVDLAGYDLTDPAEIAKAEKRIRSAARKVCPRRQAGSPAEHDAQALCRNHAEQAALAQLRQRAVMFGG